MSSLAPSSITWDLTEPEAKEKISWNLPTEEDTLLEEALENASAIVSGSFDEEEPTILSAAFARTQKFLHNQSREMNSRLGYFPPAPYISPGPNGSADLHWKQAGWGLLLNIPATDAVATFYGDCTGNGKVKGHLDPNSWHLGITTWLSK